MAEQRSPSRFRNTRELTQQMATIPGELECVGYEQITDLSAAVALNPPAGARLAFMIVEAAAVRYRTDGVDPTATVGMPIKANTIVMFDDGIFDKKFIEQSSGAILNVEYYR